MYPENSHDYLHVILLLILVYIIRITKLISL